MEPVDPDLREIELLADWTFAEETHKKGSVIRVKESVWRNSAELGLRWKIPSPPKEGKAGK